MTSHDGRPRVSVLLPVRDGEAHVGEALGSVLEQTLTDLEVVVVDDGSSDGTRAVVERLARRDGRVVVLSTPPRGIVAALNLGLSRCRGPFIARMDGDDRALPRRLEAQVKVLESEPSLAVVGCLVAAHPASVEGERGGMARYLSWLNGLVTSRKIEADLFVESPLAHPSVVIRAGAIRAVGGYREFPGPEDYDLWLRLWEAGAAFAKVPEVLLWWRDSPGRLSRTHPRYSREAFLATKLAALTRTHIRGGRALILWGGGLTGKAWARALRRRGLVPEAVVDIHPDRVGQRVQGIPVIAPDDLPPPGAAFLLGAVATPGARPLIRTFLRERGYQEGKHFVMVA